MKIVATYIIYDNNSGNFYKLHECIGLNHFNREYFEERGLAIYEVDSKVARELIENSGKSCLYV